MCCLSIVRENVIYLVTTFATLVFSAQQPYATSTDLARTTFISSPKVFPHISCEWDPVGRTAAMYTGLRGGLQ